MNLEFLRSVDSPTIANAIEPFKLRDRCEGFLGGSIRCLFPDLGVMVGYALTVTMTSEVGPPPGREGYWNMWEALEQAPKPAVVVVQDISRAPTRCAYFGEVMATIASRLGAVGVVNELIRGDVYFWGTLMAGALLGSVPVAIVYSFFVDNYVSGLTAGAVKG